MPFPFLDLSLELRNCIYKHFLQLASTERNCLYLTQVCQQIRSELRPLYMDIRAWVDMKDCQVGQYLDAFLPGWNEPDKPTTDAFTFIAIRVCCVGPRWSSVDPADYPLITLPDVEVKLVTTYPPYRGDQLCNRAYQWGLTVSILFDGALVLARTRCSSWLRSRRDSFVQYLRVVLDGSVTVDCTCHEHKHECTTDFLEELGIGEWDHAKCSIWWGLQESMSDCDSLYCQCSGG